MNNDYISKEPLELARAIDGLTEWQKHVQTDSNINRDITIAIEALKAQLGTPKQRTGKWISADAIFHAVPFYCSECGEQTLDIVMGKPRAKYCPSCGCRMEGSAE